METIDKLKEGEWVLVVSNYPWPSPVYIFSLAIKSFQWLLREDNWTYNHAARVKDGVVIEMLSRGRTETKLDEWLVQRDRKVAVLKPSKPFIEVPTKPYGYFDIVQIVLHWIRKKLKIGRGWNGEDGVPIRYTGLFCSEEVSLSLGRNKAHLVLPCQLIDFQELSLEDIIYTKLNK